MVERPRFERLALPHMAAAYNLAFWLVRNRADAEDVVQDAYLRAYRAFASFKGDDMRPWLLKIVRNVALSWLGNRNSARNVISFDEALSQRVTEAPGTMQVADDEPSPETLLISADERNQLKRALAELPAVFREALVLREFEALSYREISTVIGAPIGTVMSRLSRAREELGNLLKKHVGMDKPDAM